jgi:hypothetical protein
MFLHYDFHDSFGKDVTPLGKYSFELRQSIARSDTQFVADTGYRPQSFSPIISCKGKDEEVLPNWVASRKGLGCGLGNQGRYLCYVVGFPLWNNDATYADRYRNPEGIGK